MNRYGLVTRGKPIITRSHHHLFLIIIIVLKVGIYTFSDQNKPFVQLLKIFKQVNEPRHEISNNLICATSKGSDQPVHTSRLIRAFAGRFNI